MANIRLKTISIEPSETLTIQNGDIILSNTTISTNRLNGSLVINGGIGINNTYDAVSSTSGGALTIGGGLAVYNQTFLGNNLILDSNASILSVNGISSNRLFLDTVSNKNFYISPDGINKRFDLYDTTLNINITRNSTNASTGSVVILGGLSINCTTNSTNVSNGGAFTVAGGMAVGGDIFLSKSLNIGGELLVKYTSRIILEDENEDTNTSINMINNNLGLSNNSDILFNTTNGNFIFSNINDTLLSINGDYSIFNKIVKINDTIESINLTTGSLIIKGGMSIQCTKDAVSATSGGCITIAGGISINKKTFTNDSIGIEILNNNKNNKLILYQPNGDLTQTNLYTGLGVSGGSLRLQLYNTNNDYLFYSSNSSGNSSEVFRIKGTNEVQFIGDNQRYSFLAGGNTSNDLSIQSQNIATASSLCFYTKDGDSNDNIDIKLFGKGLPNNVINSEYLKIGWDTSKYIISTNKSGTGISNPLVFQTNNNNDQLKLLINGTLYCSSTTDSINSSTGGLVLLGGLSINNTADAISLTQGGTLTVNGGMSIMKNVFIGNRLNINGGMLGDIKLYAKNTSGNLIISNPTSNFVFCGNDSSINYNSSISLFSLNNQEQNDFELLSISNNSAIYNISSKSNGSGVLHPIQLNVGNNSGIFLQTNGNININSTSSSTYQLNINGSLQANNYSYMNQLTIYNTDDAVNSSTSGCLTVMGGLSVVKKLFVGGQTIFTDTTDSSSTSASVYITGGLTVASGENSNYGVGALTVLGGGYFGGELYVQENLNVFGSINGGGSSSSTFAYLTLTATDESINLSSGSLLTFGGLTILTYANAQNVSNGGSFLTPGGASIGKDVYIGGNLNNYGIQNFYDNSNNLINFYDLSNLLKFSLDRNTLNNNFSISRYDINGTFVEKNLEISNSTGRITLNNTTISSGINNASLIVNGGITIACTSNASAIGNGGSLSVFGGTSISKNLYVGGDVSFLSTTNSTTSNDGALVVVGGVGINGNVNITGNTVINGNLSILGTTNSVYSTNTFLSDNIIVINSGPSGTSDGGILIQRFQTDNDTGSGDVVNDIIDTYGNFTLPNQSGMTTIQVKLTTLASNIDNYYNGWWIKITSGFSNNQVRKIISYVGSTRIITIDNPWTTQNPSIGDSINVYNRPYVGLIWNEMRDGFDLGTTIKDPDNSSITLSNFASLHLDDITLHNTSNSTSNTSGTLIVAGGISIINTTDATSLTTGNALTVGGGASIGKSLYVGSNVYIGGVNITPNIHDSFSTVIFTAANNASFANIPSIEYSDNTVWGFDLYLSARLIATTNMFANYQIKAVNKMGTWDFTTLYTGDSIITFNITNNGQLQYSTPNFAGFSSLIFKYKVLTN